jgi:hypothetical protein
MPQRKAKPFSSTFKVMARLKRLVKSLQFDDADIIEWCGELMEELRVHSGTQEKHEVLTVDDFYATIPCDCVDIHSVTESNGQPPRCPPGYRPATVDEQEAFTIFDVSNTVVINGITYTSSLAIRENTLSRPIDSAFRQAGGGFDKGVYVNYQVIDNCLKLDFASGFVLLRYSGLPLDIQGYAVIPKDYEEACVLECLAKLKYEDFISGKIPLPIYQTMTGDRDTAISNGRAHYHAPNRNGIDRLLQVMTSFQRRMPNETQSIHNTRY